MSIRSTVSFMPGDLLAHAWMESVQLLTCPLPCFTRAQARIQTPFPRLRFLTIFAGGQQTSRALFSEGDRQMDANLTAETCHGHFRRHDNVLSSNEKELTDFEHVFVKWDLLFRQDRILIAKTISWFYCLRYFHL